MAPTTKTFNVGTSQDAVSTIYLLRNVDFSKFKVGLKQDFYSDF
jgi:hypothetical protein